MHPHLPPSRHPGEGAGLLSRLQLVICGLGGQGTVFLSRVIAEAAIADGHEVMVSETHGMAQRGGAVESYIRIGGFAGPVVRPGHADAVLVLDQSRLAAGQRFAHEDATCFVNAKEPIEGAAACDAFGVAKQLANERGTNLVLFGFAATARPELFPDARHCLDTVRRLSPPAVRDRNVLAFERGAALVGDCL
ncbi:MAG: 2-oxoacid:acceptor oxidoreductase family protein [Planctomycetota bacterium]